MKLPIAAAVLVVLSGPAQAQYFNDPPSGVGEPQPWATGWVEWTDDWTVFGWLDDMGESSEEEDEDEQSEEGE